MIYHHYLHIFIAIDLESGVIYDPLLPVRRTYPNPNTEHRHLTDAPVHGTCHRVSLLIHST